MIRKLAKLIRNPAKYVPLAFKITQQQLCPIFQGLPFFLQGQMDINPKSRWHNPEFVELTGGYFQKGDQARRQICNLEPWDNTRRDILILLLRTIVESDIEGDIAELGVYRGLTAKLIHYYMPERRLHLFDTFAGFTDRSVIAEQQNTRLSILASHFADTTLDNVKRQIAPKNTNVFFYQGYFPESIPEDFAALRFALVHLDADLYEPTVEGLKFFYPRMSEAGMIVVHDYNAWPGARKAVDEFFSDKKELPIPLPDKSGSALIVKQTGPAEQGAAPDRDSAPLHRGR